MRQGLFYFLIIKLKIKRVIRLSILLKMVILLLSSTVGIVSKTTFVRKIIKEKWKNNDTRAKSNKGFNSNIHTKYFITYMFVCNRYSCVLCWPTN